MLRDSDIQSLDDQLGLIARESQQHHTNLQELLQRFQALLESYNSLKSDYEEEKEAREKYKKLARGQERNPFVLVLIDGDGYIFKDYLIKSGSEGGITAARLLSDSIRDVVHSTLGSQADQCRIMVRIYANILGLSKSMARAGLVGHDARSLAPFVSNFTRSQDLFDFVDAGDKKEGADYKIREMFRLFADNNQCKHIFFGGCHDTGYLSLLTPYRGKTDRITLLKAAGFHSEYETLDLPVRELPSVFMSTQFNGNVNNSTTTTPNKPSNLTTSVPNKPVCKHYQKGICRFGNECNKLHVMPNQQLTRTADDTLHQSWRSPTVSTLSNRQKENYANLLPSPSLKAEEFIPINKDGERIDTYCPSPPKEAWDTYQRRMKQQRICNNYHLGGECPDLSCPYDHSDVDQTILDVMKFILRQHPCSRGGACRSIKCYIGHLCQKEGCVGKPCRFSRHAHNLDLNVAQWVSPVDGEEADDSPVSEISRDGSFLKGIPLGYTSNPDQEDTALLVDAF